MRARIKVWGKSYLIEAIDWLDDGGIANVSFTDEITVFHTIHNNQVMNVDNVERNRYLRGVKYTDLNKVISWE